MYINCVILLAIIFISGSTIQARGPPPKPVVGQIFPTKLDRLFIVSQLGKGSYGTVYKCRSMRLQRDVALKVQHPMSWDPVAEGKPLPRYMRIEHESTMLNALSGMGYPDVYESGFHGPVKFYVMEIAGEGSLGSYIRKRPDGILPHHIACHIGAQMFRTLEAVHQRRILIYDIHPDNMMYQRIPGGLLRLRLIDPGMAFFYVTADGRHLEPLETSVPPWNKSQLWTCQDDDNQIIASRRCEIQRVLYVMLSMIQGGLPWMFESDPESMIEMKRRIHPVDLCSNPAAQFLLPAFEHAFSLGYKEKPDYNFIIGIFKAQFQKDIMRMRGHRAHPRHGRMNQGNLHGHRR